MEGEKPAIRDNIPRDKQTWKVWSESSDMKMTSFRQENCWLKKVLDKNRYDSLNSEIDKLMEEVRGLADVLGLEIEELPLDFPFFALPAEEVGNE